MKVYRFETWALCLFVSLTAAAQSDEKAELSPAEEVIEKVFSPDGNKAPEPLKKLVKVVTEQQAILSERARKEIDKYRIRLTIDPLGGIFDSDEALTEGGLFYQIVVEPAFRDQDQLRRDVWTVDLGVGSGLSAKGTLRLTFSRYFSGPNAKLEALTAKPYCPLDLGICQRRTPLNSNEVKTLLKDKEGFRFEILGDVAVGVSRDLSNGNIVGGSYARYKRGAHFIMDLYKANAVQSRTRFIGVKNSGELELGVSLQDPITAVFSGALSFIRRKLKLGFWINGRRSFDFFQERKPRTLDTMMVDYQFNFSTPEILSQEAQLNQNTAEFALDEILKNVRKGGFSSLFLYFYKGSVVSEELLSKAKTAESHSHKDMQLFRNKEIPSNQIRVINHFKGRIVSYIQGIDLGASVFGLLAGNNHAGSQSNFVVSYDSHQNPQFFRLENSFVRRNSRSLFGRNKFQFTNDIDLLLHSDRNAALGDISDVVVKTELQDTELDADDVQQIKNIVLNIVPRPYKEDPKLIEAVGSGSKTNASYVYKSSYGEEAFLVANSISFEILHQKLIDYFDNHPRRRLMQLPPDQSGDGMSISLHEYTGQMALNIKRIMDPNFAVPKERQINPEDSPALRKARLEAFQTALGDPIFEIYLMPEFFPQLLPEGAAQKYSSFEIKSSSFETPTLEYKLGENQISQLYEAVAFVRALITDRSLNLQMTNTLKEPETQAK
jgi:hypothetical protein